MSFTIINMPLVRTAISRGISSCEAEPCFTRTCGCDCRNSLSLWRCSGSRDEKSGVSDVRRSTEARESARSTIPAIAGRSAISRMNVRASEKNVWRKNSFLRIRMPARSPRPLWARGTIFAMIRRGRTTPERDTGLEPRDSDMRAPRFYVAAKVAPCPRQTSPNPLHPTGEIPSASGLSA